MQSERRSQQFFPSRTYGGLPCRELEPTSRQNSGSFWRQCFPLFPDTPSLKPDWFSVRVERAKPRFRDGLEEGAVSSISRRSSGCPCLWERVDNFFEKEIPEDLKFIPTFFPGARKACPPPLLRVERLACIPDPTVGQAPLAVILFLMVIPHLPFRLAERGLSPLRR